MAVRTRRGTPSIAPRKLDRLNQEVCQGQSGQITVMSTIYDPVVGNL